MGEVKKIYPNGRAADPDTLMESLMGELDAVVLLGWTKDGDDFRMCSTNNITLADVSWLLTLAGSALVDAAHDTEGDR